MTLNSPWIYLCNALFAEIARRNSVTVNIKPCTSRRHAYRMMELKRRREVHGIPVSLDAKHFPCDDTSGTRPVIAAKLKGKATSCHWS